MGLKKHSVASLALGLLILCSLLLVELRLNLQVTGSKPDLERLVSLHPPGWKVIDGPQEKFLWDKSVLAQYDVVASRRYQHTDGRKVLVVMTWSGDGFRRQGHDQQVCYGASGFTVSSQHSVAIQTGAGIIEAMAFTASQPSVEEDVLYWRVTDGTREIGINSRNTMAHRLQRLLYLPNLFQGKLPDNLMVRVSSVRERDGQPATTHFDYIREWPMAISSGDRVRIMGR